MASFPLIDRSAKTPASNYVVEDKSEELLRLEAVELKVCDGRNVNLDWARMFRHWAWCR
jgi:hypothetical protein